MANRPARMRHQKLKSLELAWCQVYLNSTPFDAPSNRIQHHSSDDDRHLGWSFRRPKSPNGSTDPCYQLACLKWLGHVVVGSDLQCLDLVIFTIPDGQHEN